MNTAQAVESLKSDTCPGCGGYKQVRRSVCSRCWASLPGPMRDALYRKFANGYVDAITAAAKRLRGFGD